MKHSLKHVALLPLVAVLAACGGAGSGTSSDGGNTGPDTTAPQISGLSVSQPVNGQITINVAATDNVGATGFCATQKSGQPAATDACFQASNQLSVPATMLLSPYYIWVKDAAGNVSTATQPWPCSTAGIAASTAYTSGSAVCMMTSVGELVLGLANSKAPVTTANFLKYVNAGFYGGTVFHRIASTFVAQGGGYQFVNGTYVRKNTLYDPIVLEKTSQTKLSNTSYTIAMARTADLNSATDEFYINLVDNSKVLDASSDNGNTGYAVFGAVISGVGTTTAALQSTQVVSNGSELSLPIKPPVIYWAYQLK